MVARLCRSVELPAYLYRQRRKSYRSTSSLCSYVSEEIIQMMIMNSIKNSFVLTLAHLRYEMIEELKTYNINTGEGTRSMKT